MIASIPSLGQDYKDRACGWRAFDRLCSTKYGRIKRCDAGVCLTASLGGPDWSNQVLGPLLLRILKTEEEMRLMEQDKTQPTTPSDTAF